MSREEGTEVGFCFGCRPLFQATRDKMPHSIMPAPPHSADCEKGAWVLGAGNQAKVAVAFEAVFSGERKLQMQRQTQTLVMHLEGTFMTHTREGTFVHLNEGDKEGTFVLQ